MSPAKSPPGKAEGETSAERKNLPGHTQSATIRAIAERAPVVALVQKHRAWTLMNRPDGSYFAAWEEFCAHRQPWGLGKPWEQLQPFVEAVLGKRATQLATVSPARQGERTDMVETSGTECPKLPARTEKQLRAIAERAPEPVRERHGR